MRITLDPGHGGRDPGSEGNGLLEKVENLEYALELGRCLQKLGFIVDYTRTTDVYVSLADRAAHANNFGADIFVSWHFNYFDGSGRAKGIEVYSLASTGTGAKLANAVVAEMALVTGAVNRGAKTANYQVLRDTVMPAILIEGSFLDNVSDAALIKTETYKRKCMIGATKGICKVLGITWKNPYEEANTVENAILVYGPDDTVTARRLAESMGNCAIFFRKADGSASPDVKVAKTLYIVGGGSVGHPNEKILSGPNYFRTVEAVGKSMG